MFSVLHEVDHKVAGRVQHIRLVTVYMLATLNARLMGTYLAYERRNALDCGLLT